MAGVLRAGLKRVHPSIGHDVSRVIQMLAVNGRARRWLNACYRRLSFRQMSAFHGRFAKLFREVGAPVDEGRWVIDFGGRQVLAPLTARRFWLDWDAALSILGHETEIKRTYLSLIRSPTPPDLFLDIGAGYGTHSVLFLVHGIETVSFEPNASCHDYFRELCALNGVTPSIVGVALGDSAGWADVWFPETETWLGTTNPGIRQELAIDRQLVTRRVEQATLDEQLGNNGHRGLLLKIDTEGSEYAILRGAARTLEAHRPLVIFESFRDQDRNELFALLRAFRYEIHDLPWARERSGAALERSTFCESPASNFIAVPAMPRPGR